VNQHNLKDTSCMQFETQKYLNVRHAGNISDSNLFLYSVASIDIDVFVAYSRCYVPLQVKLIPL